MKILFNCTTNVVGGGVKNSAIFIKYAIEDFRFEWGFAISSQVKEILDRWGIDTSNMELFIKSPAKNYSQRKRLLEYSNNNNFNIVFTMAGPAYVKFDIKHVMGMSNPYISHVDFQGFTVGKSTSDILKDSIKTLYQSFFSRKADYFIFQTNASRKSFCKRLRIKEENTQVISNAIDQQFIDTFNDYGFIGMNKNKKIKIFCPAAAYKHKVLHLIPSVAKELLKKSKSVYEFEFILTIDKDSLYWKEINILINEFDLKNEVKTIGAFNYADAVELYKNCDIVFVPSILETFSASYIEAFAAKKPLIVSSKNFSQDICKNAAVFVNPFEYEKTASEINILINDVELQKQIVKKGKKVLKLYGTQKERYNKITTFLKNIGEKINV